MAVSTTTAVVSQAGNGVTTAVTIPYYFLANSHLVVILKVDATGVETTKTITTHYTVTGAGNPVGGTVTMLTAPATGETLIVKRVVPQTQASRYLNDDTYDVTNIEADFDKMVMLVQDLQRKIDLCIQFPSTETITTTLESNVDRADTLLGFDSDGDISLSTTDAASAAAAAASASAAASSASGASTSAAAAAVSAAAATAVGNGVLTTKGDIVSYSTLAVRVAVGANDTVLFADSTATPGVAYKTIDLSTSRIVGVNTVAKGGTGLSALGTALQVPRVNAGATALEFATPIFSKSFTSTAQTITAAGTLTLAHSLGAAPELIRVYLKCTSADTNYSVNDILEIPAHQAQSGVNCGCAPTSDATNVYIRFGSTATTFVVLDKTTGAYGTIDNSKWQLFVKAWL